MSFDTFAKVLRCPVYTYPFLGLYPKSAIANTKVPFLKTFSRENKLDLFFRLVPKCFCRTQGIMSDTDIVNRMFIIFAFSLYNMPFFTPP